MSPAVNSNENIENSNYGMQTFEFQTLHSDIVKGVAFPEANVLESQECFKPGAPKFAAKCKELDSRSFGYRFVKRLLDVAFSLCVVVVGFVPCLVLCGAIALDTKGSPIYTQERIGRCGKPFRIFKFRTMVADSENVEKYLSPEQLEMWNRERKVDNDPRITPLGRVLRGTSVDELPQFINVIRNDFPLRILKTRPEFSEKSMGAFALPAKSSTNKGKAFSQVVSCFANGLRMRRISKFNCNRIRGMEAQFLAKPVFGAVCA
ncbi:MAG: sugar transferase [Paraeggerthella sp.]|nr:sugar transferase [Paraeggerthella sp.]